MKKVLILCLHRPGRSPSQRFRFEQYLSFLEQNGYSFDFSYLLNEQDDKVFYKAGNYSKKFSIVLSSAWKRATECIRIKNYDLIFVQREAFMLGTAFFEKLMARKVPLIFDFDDSIWLQNVSEANKRLAFLKDASKTAKIIQSAALVFAGNQYLADYAKQFNSDVVVVPTTIDMNLYRAEKKETEDKPVCIGWSGSFSTIQFFAYAIPALKRIKEKYGDKVCFRIIGDENYYCKELETRGLPWKAPTEVEDLAAMDIGIMPLPTDEWTKGKCGLKGLQYMALGIPSMMSPVGVNTEIIIQGINGFLPATEEEWVDVLSRLIESKGLRERIGEAGLKTVRERFSTEAWKNKYLLLFNELLEKKNLKIESIV
jgi:glycosyltransferase involved in cell wall biosynthesis